ncbi:glycosyltransferase 87 family protein [Streptomyces sp. ACA25]|uniref:glycosyltransferase family 87 protein n=1 Tax=Streptomyces sp. ACA25 TaxID=3022596 RepID=UPI002307F547|nr:glycosyltransferase 87 family protein [Streptomyces sp. ACA25]MDB1086241.1 glycosyltransferase 87 family protein [Streptomyces sp. ACA25]
MVYSGRPHPAEPVRPTEQDEVAAAGSELIGGPAGKRIRPGTGWWTPVRIITLVMTGMFALGLVQKLPCYRSSWFHGPADQYTRACYSDIPHLYGARGFAEGLIPYFDRIPEELSRGMEYLEYPVLTGLFMEVAAWLTPGEVAGQRPEQIYWLVNAGLLLICALIIAVCVSRIHRNRPWDGLLVALSPAFALTATINWDLFAGALACAALLMWSRGRPLATGVLLGLATAAKLYPLLLLGPLLLLCWRAGRLRAFALTAAGATGAWLTVNLPVMLLATEGWAKFYTFSQERPVDFGSFWLVLAQRTDLHLPPETVNPLATGLVLLGCAAIGLLALAAPRRPRLAQLAFLVVAVFVLTNKVYSPQYVLWLIPLAVLARPRWRDFLIWQTCEVLYFLSIWMYLAQTSGAHGLPAGGYQLAIVLHLAGTLYLCTMVVRDVLRPEHDMVRRDGSDDPGGGVLDRAPDRFTLRRRPVPRTGLPDHRLVEPAPFHVKRARS